MIFSSPTVLAQVLATEVAAALRYRLEHDGQAVLAVSGGTTPVRFFQALSVQKLDWRNVTITLVDDRWVDPASPRSNAALVRMHLLQAAAAKAQFSHGDFR